MHNFFTRIFLSFWAVIVLIAACVAAVTAIDLAATQDRPSAVIRAATEALNRDGIQGLRVWLAERNRSRPGQHTFVVDSTGRDILGQKRPAFRRPGGLAGSGGPEFLPRGQSQRMPGPLADDRGGGRPDGPFGLMPPPSENRGPPPDADLTSPPREPNRAGQNPLTPPDGERVLREPRGFRQFGPLASLGFAEGLRWLPAVIRGKDGAFYRLIFDPPPRRGAFSPPFSWWVRAGLLALALAVSGLVSYLLARSISTPVRRLQTAAHTLSAGNLDARAGSEVTRRKDELGVLGREFDSMADRLSTLIAARQRLLRDISHELRSPLARMEMAIGLARQDPGSTHEQLDRVERESDRLDQLIGHILEYARLERDPSTFTFEELDVADLVRQIVHDAEFESQSPPDRLRLTSEDTVKMRGEPNVLHSAIDNVVRNALLHGDPRLPIMVTLSDDADAVRLSVRDHGTGVREEDLPHIFEPFYRAGAKDSNHVSTEGTGIGLAITQRAAALHGGEVSASNAEGGGLLVTITLPRGRV
ncbi:MAG: ATP-binding protein [Gammaproteobacteria bacterium]